MKKSVKWILAAAVAAAAFVGIYFLYGSLKDRYAPEQFAEVTESTGQQEPEETEETAAPDFTVLDENGGGGPSVRLCGQAYCPEFLGVLVPLLQGGDAGL